MLSTAIDRRTLLAGAGALVASGLTPKGALALERSELLFLAAARRPDQSYAITILSERGEIVREVPLPARGHDLAIDGRTGRAVAFARRPGTFAVAFDAAGTAEPLVFTARPDRHFYGHGAFSADGRVLYASENDFGAARGVVGIYDVGAGYHRIGEFPTYGIGPHELILMPDGRTLAVANGGIETNPLYGRDKLNLATMQPSLCFLDVASGDLVARHTLPTDLHQLSIRHLAADATGQVWFGTQWQGSEGEQPQLLGRARVDGEIRLADMPGADLGMLRGYIGGMAASGDGSVIAASSPPGGVVVYLDAASGKLVGRTGVMDGSGIRAAGTGRFMVSSGSGTVVEATVGGESLAASTLPRNFDAHLRALPAQPAA
ncbi:hypothetical protein SAMN05216548_11230 [Faunimonas pinastri]|uniref:DUF1513 domain-containing protein n=1 Tax=Faunimonas pinastri TaxID=1855383 RepID=A0A1H9LVG0_9HYPH|nr:DUF1513 domain-containing protein [Faunimonas pinastri]SER15239.1 hypothetical protein SAMN05216548_11230 [Faunimonas pinastri]